MRFDRESWRKLYVVESAQHRLLPILTRGIRDYLLRLASDDGTLLPETDDPKRDLVKLLNADPSEKKAIGAAYDQLIKIGYLSLESRRLWITKFAEAQAARSPGAKRQADYKSRQRERVETLQGLGTGNVSGDSQASVTGDAQSDATVTSQIDETRRDETTIPQPPAVAPEVEALGLRAEKVLQNPYDGEWEQPSKWPETLAVGESWSFGMQLRLRDNVNGDSDLRAILEAFRDRIPVPSLVTAGRRAKAERERGEGPFAKMQRPGPAAFTAAILRRLLADDEVTGVRLRQSGEVIDVSGMNIKLGAEGL